MSPLLWLAVGASVLAVVSVVLGIRGVQRGVTIGEQAQAAMWFMSAFALVIIAIVLGIVGLFEVYGGAYAR